MRNIDYIELGATLFVPAVHENLQEVVSGKKYPNLKSVLIDTEDSIKENDVEIALNALKALLENLDVTKVLVFVRPRNIKVLKEILKYENIQKVDGFILPKFSLSNAIEYLEILKDKPFYFMPSIEGNELFDTQKLYELRDILLGYQEQILLVRFGLEDMLRQLKMRRKCEDSIFDFASTSSVMGDFISVFKSSGFEISGGVYPCFNDSEGFIRDVKRDLKEGLFSKTIIHPNQIDLTNEIYRVSALEFDEALQICESTEVIFAQDSKMAETTTMSPWAKEIIKRAEVYGTN